MLVLAGCNGGEEEPTAGPEPTTVEPSEPETATEDEPSAGPEEYPLPERPEAMDHDDLDGAEAAAVYFVELFYYAMATGDLELWDAMSGEACAACSTIVTNISELYESGGHVETSPPRFEEPMTHIYPNEGGDYLVEFTTHTPQTRHYSGTGELERDDPGIVADSLVLLSHTAGEWEVASFQNEVRADES